MWKICICNSRQYLRLIDLRARIHIIAYISSCFIALFVNQILFLFFFFIMSFVVSTFLQIEWINYNFFFLFILNELIFYDMNVLFTNYVIFIFVLAYFFEKQWNSIDSFHFIYCLYHPPWVDLSFIVIFLAFRCTNDRIVRSVMMFPMQFCSRTEA